MKYKLPISILVIFLIQTSFVMASPVISIDEKISENVFNSCSYTNPDSIEAHQIVVYSEDGEHSQIHLNYNLVPRTTTSPDGNYSVFLRFVGAGEDFVINNTVTGTTTHIKNIITMGYYPVAFSPDSKMYAAPRVVFFENCRNGQYAIDICSVHNNTLLHREFTPFYIENTKDTPMEWDKAAIYGVYWSDDGASIIYEALGADTDGGRYPSYLVSKRLNVDYPELRKMNGYEESDLKSTQEDAEENGDTVPSSPIPGFGGIGAVVALVLNRKMKRA